MLTPLTVRKTLQLACYLNALTGMGGGLIIISAFNDPNSGPHNLIIHSAWCELKNHPTSRSISGGVVQTTHLARNVVVPMWRRICVGDFFVLPHDAAIWILGRGGGDNIRRTHTIHVWCSAGACRCGHEYLLPYCFRVCTPLRTLDGKFPWPTVQGDHTVGGSKTFLDVNKRYFTNVRRGFSALGSRTMFINFRMGVKSEQTYGS